MCAHRQVSLHHVQVFFPQVCHCLLHQVSRDPKNTEQATKTIIRTSYPQQQAERKKLCVFFTCDNGYIFNVFRFLQSVQCDVIMTVISVVQEE